MTIRLPNGPESCFYRTLWKLPGLGTSQRCLQVRCRVKTGRFTIYEFLEHYSRELPSSGVWMLAVWYINTFRGCKFLGSHSFVRDCTELKPFTQSHGLVFQTGGSDSRIPSKAKRLYLLQNVQTECGAHPSLTELVSWSFWGGKSARAGSCLGPTLRMSGALPLLLLTPPCYGQAHCYLVSCLRTLLLL
jgi:hypothetical protein